MADQEYIILSEPEASARLGVFAAAGLSRPDVAVQLEEATLSRREHTDLLRNRRTRAIAPAMSMKLIAPVSIKAAPAAAGHTWGVAAVHADSSGFDGSGVTDAARKLRVELAIAMDEDGVTIEFAHVPGRHARWYQRAELPKAVLT